MNTEVRATGLQITAKTESTYLMIGSGDKDTAEEIQALVGGSALTTAINVSAEDAQVLPSAHGTIATATAAGTYANWYTAAALDHGAAEINETTKQALSSTNFAKYVIKRTVYLTVAKGSVESGDIKVALENVANVGDGTKNAAVAIVLACGDTVIELNEANEWASETAITTAVNEEGVKQVDIYIYYDGNNEQVFTDNFANLSGKSFGILFSVAE